MVIDYKGVSFSFKDIRKAKRIRRFRLATLLLLLVFIYVLIANGMDSGKIGTVQDVLLEGKLEDAQSRFKKIESSWFHGDSKLELKALLHLFSGEFSAAEALLTELGDSSTIIESHRFLNYFSYHGAYRALGIYTRLLMKKDEDAAIKQELLFYRGLADAALFQYKESEEAIKKMSPELRQKHAKALALLQKTNRRVRSGKVDYIFDVNGLPLAYYDTVKKKTISLAPGFSFDAFTGHVQQGIRYYRLSLDRDIQIKLHRLFRKYNGTFLLLDVSDSSIAAAYSRPLPAAGKPWDDITNPVLTELYEPGSIIKLLTFLAFLDANPGPDGGGLFPFQCDGLWKLEDRVFYDWIRHKKVETIDDALAVSCNLAFAGMGNRLGYQGLNAMFNRFYFNSPDLGDRFLVFKTGKTSPAVSGAYRLGKMAVGLDSVTMSTFHASLMAALISNDGSLYDPYLIKNEKNALNIAYYNHQPRLTTVFKNNTAFFKLKNAMVYVVESPDGTGRRSRVDGVPVALKTGTAGNKKQGLDAVLAGFFPADKPRYAFAFRLQRVGKAEWKGAFFLRDFLTAFYSDRTSGSK
jgi:hypothetical protein